MRDYNPRLRKKLYGIGINDAEYRVRIYEVTNGRSREVWRCPFFRTWGAMVDRCYSPKYTAKNPSYQDCSVCNDWLSFSKFKAWMETQDWKGKQLDKDILVPGNKVYSPETCVFVPGDLNSFLVAREAARGRYPLGVYFEPHRNKFRARCDNPFTRESDHLGRFSTPEEAHEAWRQRKHELACQYADMQTDPRIAEALRTRFALATLSTSNEPEEVCNA